MASSSSSSSTPMKIISSFDIGVKNLGESIVEYDPNDFTKFNVLKIDRIDISEDTIYENTKVRKINSKTLCECLIKYLEKNYNEYKKSDYIVIESQPALRMKMDRICFFAYGYFASRGLKVVFIDPKKKLNVFASNYLKNDPKNQFKECKTTQDMVTQLLNHKIIETPDNDNDDSNKKKKKKKAVNVGGSNYQQNKKHAMRQVDLLAEDLYGFKKNVADYYLSLGNKRDDAADALLQALSFIKYNSQEVMEEDLLMSEEEEEGEKAKEKPKSKSSMRNKKSNNDDDEPIKITKKQGNKKDKSQSPKKRASPSGSNSNDEKEAPSKKKRKKSDNSKKPQVVPLFIDLTCTK